MSKGARAHTHWTEKEVSALRWLWGTVSVSEIAKKLQRTQTGVLRKAVNLDLGGIHRGSATKTMAQVARETGYEANIIRKVATNVGLNIRRICRGDRGAKPRDYAVSPEQEEKIIAYLREHGRGRIFFHKGTAFSPRGMWGVGRKPPVCTICGKDDKPHYATGKCKMCYDVSWRESRKVAA